MVFKRSNPLVTPPLCVYICYIRVIWPKAYYQLLVILWDVNIDGLMSDGNLPVSWSKLII